MTETELYTELVSLGLPVAYSSFSKPTPPPFIIYLFTADSDVKADNHNYVGVSNYDIELYTAKKDKTLEGLLEAKLKELRLPYSKVENWLGAEELHQITYGIQLVGG